MKIKTRIEKEIKLLEKEREQYVNVESWDYKYRYYTLSGKIDVLKDFLNGRKRKLKDAELLKHEVQEDYIKIRMIPKHKRSEYQYLEGIYLEGKLDIINNMIVPAFSKE